MTRRPTFYEFFAGGGMARAGLGAAWNCLYANDFDLKKVSAYAANWGYGEIRQGDIHRVNTADLPGAADLAWGSFPCQDLSLAGNGAGLGGERSQAFWGFWRLAKLLGEEGRGPRLLVLENVVGALTSNNGADFQEICRALKHIGYRFGALTMDAVHFLPQSRPRLFIVAMRNDCDMPAGLSGDKPTPVWASAALQRAAASLPEDLRESWVWWKVAPPKLRNQELIQMIEDAPRDTDWHAPAETQKFLAMMSKANRVKYDAARASGERVVGAIYRRTRQDEDGRKVQRAEVRFDGVAGCLRTPGGGSSRQFIMVVEGKSVRTRLLSGREAARLMGLPDAFRLPANYNEAYHLLGDGLAVPVVRHLAEHLLEPLLAGQVEPYRAAAE